LRPAAYLSAGLQVETDSKLANLVKQNTKHNKCKRHGLIDAGEPSMWRHTALQGSSRAALPEPVVPGHSKLTASGPSVA
jgi:hypothetical protein